MKHLIITISLLGLLSCNSGQKNDSVTTDENKDSQSITTNADKANGANVNGSFDCKSVITDADAKGLNFEKVEEKQHSDFYHDFWIIGADGETMADIGIAKSGEDGYKGGVGGAKMLADGMKVGKQEFKGTFAEENKYGNKSYLAVASWTNSEIGILKGDYYISIKAYKRKNQTIEQATELARKLAEISIGRMP